MKLSDIMSAMQLEIYAEVALVLFLCAFLIVLSQVLSGKKEEWQRAAHLPLEESQQCPGTSKASDEPEQIPS